MIPWDIPTSDEEIPRLTHIYRNQHFLVWLAAMDLESKVKERLSSRPEHCIDVCFACQPDRTSTSFVPFNGRRSSRLPWIPNGSEVADRYSFLIHLLSSRSSTTRTCPFQRAHSTHPQVNLRRGYVCTGRNNVIQILANSAQVLVWRPTSGQPTLVVPPKSIEINTSNCAYSSSNAARIR